MRIAKLLDLRIAAKGKLVGQVLSEAMADWAMPNARRDMTVSAPDTNGHVTTLMTLTVGETVYFDSVGYLGCTLGLPDPKAVPAS